MYINIIVSLPTVHRKTLGTTFISDSRESVKLWCSHSMELYTTIINYIFKEYLMKYKNAYVLCAEKSRL